jgi:hypothetical protein
MATLADILKQRDDAVAILQQKLQDANDLKNSGAVGMDNTINSLVAKQAEVAAQAYTAGLDDPTMTQALAALTAATTQMKAVAAIMVSVTTFISNVASLVTATNKAISALKGSG